MRLATGDDDGVMAGLVFIVQEKPVKYDKARSLAVPGALCQDYLSPQSQQSQMPQMRDLSAQPEHAEKVQELLAAMRREQSAHGDQRPLEVAHPQPAAWSPPAP